MNREHSLNTTTPSAESSSSEKEGLARELSSEELESIIGGATASVDVNYVVDLSNGDVVDIKDVVTILPPLPIV